VSAGREANPFEFRCSGRAAHYVETVCGSRVSEALIVDRAAVGIGRGVDEEYLPNLRGNAAV